MAKEYMRESEQQRRESRPEDEIKSYCDILRDQRRDISDSFATEQVAQDDEPFDYRPIKIPKKPDTSDSYLTLRLKHDRVLSSTKKSSRYKAKLAVVWLCCGYKLRQLSSTIELEE